MPPIPRVLRKSLLAGARQAEGLAVVIDVLRAFTSAAVMAYLGAEKIILLAEPQAVLALKREQGYLAVGEVDGRPPPGFDLGNSPWRILQAGRGCFAGQAVAQRTTAGTAGAVAAARRADAVFLGSYLTARATACYIRRLSPAPQVVSLIAMGEDGLCPAPEDEACAEYLEALLTGRAYDHAAALQRIVAHDCAQRFLRHDQDHFPPEDVVLSLQRDLFDFALVAAMEEGYLVARRIDVQKEPER